MQQVAKVCLRQCIVRFCGFCEPGFGLLRVLGHSGAVLKEHAIIVHPARIILLGCFAIPLNSLVDVLRSTYAIIIAVCQVALGRGTAAPGGLLIP